MTYIDTAPQTHVKYGLSLSEFKIILIIIVSSIICVIKFFNSDIIIYYKFNTLYLFIIKKSTFYNLIL